MGYAAGVDLGTSFSGVAIVDQHSPRPAMASLGSRADVVPSLLHLRDDGTWAVGEAAAHRAMDSPGRVAREFKRRLGDQAPVFVGGTPSSADALMAALLKGLIGKVEATEGRSPDSIVLTHPANWGAYRLELFQQVPRLAGISSKVELVPEPVAAALHYATLERLPDGETVAVYDLGGGTFDATIVRLHEGVPVILGRPEGVERLGGMDFDAAIFEVVRSAAEDLFSGLDGDDPLVLAAVAQVREACRVAKEVLSEESAATVVVGLPTGMRTVRVTRQEFEQAIRPLILLSIESLFRAIESSGLTADAIGRVLLVGGSSRIPLVSGLISSELRRPVAVDANPKHAVALGAALAARTVGEVRSWTSVGSTGANELVADVSQGSFGPAMGTAPTPGESAGTALDGESSGVALPRDEALDELADRVREACALSGRTFGAREAAQAALPFSQVDARWVNRLVVATGDALCQILESEASADGRTIVEGMVVPVSVGRALDAFVEDDDPPALYVMFESVLDG